jgi:ATP-binding cassette, subfamily C, bacterial PrsD
MRPNLRAKPATAALKSLRSGFLGVGIFSAFISLLMLTSSIYMLQVYDRVLSSRSVATLIGISLIVLAAYCVQGILDAARTRMLARIGAEFDRVLSSDVFGITRRLHLRGARPEQSMQGVRDLDTVRGFLSSQGPTAFFDMPFMPIFFIGCFLLHPYLGLMTVVGAAIIMGLTLWSERGSKEETLALTRAAAERHMLAEANRRNAEAVQAMGMGDTMTARWQVLNERFVRSNLALSDTTNTIGSMAKVFRFAFQSAVLGMGAYLVIIQQMSPGAMIAASILTSRALAPVETAVAHWKGFIAARQSFARLDDILGTLAAESKNTALPAPKSSFTAQDIMVTAPGRQTPLVTGASFELKAGHGLMLIGPSGSGKSTLMRVLASVWPATRGTIRIDGATLDQWAPEQLGRHVGYMPQDVELFDGTVAENISRFTQGADDAEIVAAAKAAGAHDVILHLADGYSTRVGEGGQTLSGGQRQRVGLARALFQNPFLILLDEPNSNLDSEGEVALVAALNGARANGSIVVVVSHKAPLLAAVDYVGRVHEGRLQIVTRDDYRRATGTGSPVAAATAQSNGHPSANSGTAAMNAALTQQAMREQLALLQNIANNEKQTDKPVPQEKRA